MDKGAAAYERFLQGEEQALDDLVKLYRSPLTNFINGYIGDYDTAEDIRRYQYSNSSEKRYHYGN